MSTTPGKAAISLSTGLEDAERVTVAFLMAVGAAEQGRPTMMFLTKEAVRLAVPGVAVGTRLRRLPAAARAARPLRAGRRALPGLPDLRPVQEDRLRHADRGCRDGRDGAAVAVDRRRRHDVQLLALSGTPAHVWC